MRIEVLVHNGEPEIYPLNKSEILIGSSEACDIIVPVRGISRKHAKITSNGPNNFFITDQGSTNGTFINEERLAPGRVSEFKSFFPVRLGDNVLLCLINDVEGQEVVDLKKRRAVERARMDASEFNDTTRVIGLNDLKKVRTSDLVRKRKENLQKGKAPPREKPREGAGKMAMTLIVSGLLVGGAAYLQWSLNGGDIAEAPKVGGMQLPKRKDIEDPAQAALRVPKEDLISKARLKGFFLDLKCTNPEELALCEASPSLREENSGAVQIGTSFVILVHEKKWLEKARLAFVKDVPKTEPEIPMPEMAPEEEPQADEPQAQEEAPATVVAPPSQEEIYQVAFLEFLSSELSGFNITLLKDKKLFLTFYKEGSSGQQVSKVMAFRDSVFSTLLQEYQASQPRLKEVGIQAVTGLEKKFTIY